ncbi:MAG: sodium:solute symporter family protein [Candidatus Omnitrophica bacterium]|nr:sodium:solute symporter family protein [Candidatus Omnitrophota bacterium]
MGNGSMGVGGIVIVFLYLTFLLLLGAFASRKIKSASDYIVAGKSMGFWLFVMLILGSTTSGMTLLGVSGLGYIGGWPTFWEQIFVPLTCAVAIIFYGYKLYGVCKKKDFLTLQDYLAYRFESPKAVRAISSFAVLITSLIYLVGQYTAISIVLKWLLGIPQIQALLVGAIIVVIYVLLGGLYAVSWTTLFQGFIIVFGVLGIAPLVINAAGGFGAINSTMAGIDPNLVRLSFPQQHPPYAGYAFATPLFLVSFFFLLAMGLGSAPHIVNNSIAVKDRKYFKWAPLVVFVMYLAVMYLVKISGMAVRTLVASGAVVLEKPDDAFLAGVKYALPHASWSLFAVVILAAVMSTTDRLLLVIGSCCGWDFYKQIFRKNASGEKVTFISRIAVIIFGLISFLLAIKPPVLLAWLIWMGIGVMLATFVVPILFGLYWKRANRQGAIWSMVAGFSAAVIFGAYDKFVVKLPFHFSFLAFFISVFFMIVVSLLTKRPSGKLIEESKTGFFIREEGD